MHGNVADREAASGFLTVRSPVIVRLCVIRRVGRPAATQYELPGYRIVAATAQRLAAEEAPGRQGAATQGAEAGDGDPCIIGTAGMEAAALPQQRAEPAFVEAEQWQQESGHVGVRGHRGRRFAGPGVFQKACLPG